MKTKPRENERRDSVIIIILILLLGFICIILASGWALRFSPSWKLNTSMGSNLNPNSDFLTGRPVSFFEPLDSAILTQPAWMDVFLTPGASFATRTPLPTLTATSVPPKTSTSTSVPTSTPSATNTLAVIVVSPTNTSVTFPPPPSTITPTATNTPIPSADLQVTKTDGVATYIPGNTLTYTITVRNNGANTVNSAVVTDNIPTQITTWTWVCTSQNGGATGCNGAVGSSANFTDTVNLPNGASIVYTVTANISSGATGLLVNTANVTVPVGYVDPILINNTATDTDTVNPQTNLGITKNDGSLTYTPGNAISYTIVVSNAGPSNATGVSVADTIPAAITGTTINCVASGTATCGTNASAGNNLSYTDVNILVGAGNFLTITVSGAVNPATTGNLVNTATVTAGTGQTDPILANNTATDTDTPNLLTNLGITKDDGSLTYAPGNAISYAIVVSNAGPSNAIGASVADTIPAAITGTTINCVASGTATCGTNASAGNALSYTGINIPAGAGNFLTITVSGTVNPATTGNLVNSATVTAGAGQTDPTLGNNTATDTDTQFIPPSADLQITKDDGVTTYTPGGTPLTYTITVTNNGPDAVIGATVIDTFPAQIISAPWTCFSVTGGTCTASGSGNINDLVNLPVGATVTYTVTAATFPNAVGTLENTAIVSAPAGFTDAPGNNSATDSDTSTSTEPNIGPPDGNWINPAPGTSITIVFSPAIIANGDVGAPDFVYYERLALGSVPPAIALDWVQIEISSDGITWHQVFYWGDGNPDTNSNVDINVIGGTEADNRAILTADLYNSTGITIDIDSVPGIVTGSYPWMRITSPAGGANGTDIDAIQPITP